MIIENGGSEGGYKAKVNKEGKLEVCSITKAFQLHTNWDKGQSFSMLIDKTPTAAGDCFAYLKNDSDDDLLISAMNLQAATDEVIEVKINDEGTPVGGTEVIPVNRNAGSGNAADGTYETGVDITGLSGGDIVEYIGLDGATGTKKHTWESFIIIPKGRTLTLYATTGGIAIKGSITGGFHNK